MAFVTEAPTAAAPDVAAAQETPLPSKTELLQQKLFGFLSGAMTSSLVGLGDKLGIFGKMKQLGKASSSNIAETCGLSHRFVLEWLYQQARNQLGGGERVSVAICMRSRQV